MRKHKYIALICLVSLLIFSGCSNDGTSSLDYWITEISDEQEEQYTSQINEISGELEEDGMRLVIAEAFGAQNVKMSSTRIVNNDGLNSSHLLLYATGQLRDKKEIINKIGTFTYIPFGRRYILYEISFIEELVVRKVVIVIEIEEDDSIKQPYHMYAFDISAKIRYRGEGASNVSTYDVLSYEYGRLPDIRKEN